MLRVGALGFNPDGKTGKLQFEYGLLCSKEGMLPNKVCLSCSS